MLAGVLLEFGLGAFTTGSNDGWIMTAALSAWLLGRRVAPRYAVLAMLVAGATAAFLDGHLAMTGFHGAIATPIVVTPVFSPSALLGIGVPLFVVTMASQNAPGVTMLENAGYRPPVSTILVVTGAMTLLLAPVGGFVLCLAAITAGICLTGEAHEDPARRYLATVAAGLAYALAGVFGGSIATGLQALPSPLVAILAGLALLPAIAGSLAAAMSEARNRDAATLTFLVTGSGVHLAGIGAPFWGLVTGVVAMCVWRFKPPLALTSDGRQSRRSPG